MKTGAGRGGEGREGKGTAGCVSPRGARRRAGGTEKKTNRREGAAALVGRTQTAEGREGTAGYAPTYVK